MSANTRCTDSDARYARGRFRLGTIVQYDDVRKRHEVEVSFFLS